MSSNDPDRPDSKQTDEGSASEGVFHIVNEPPHKYGDRAAWKNFGRWPVRISLKGVNSDESGGNEVNRGALEEGAAEGESDKAAAEQPKAHCQRARFYWVRPDGSVGVAEYD